MTRWPVRKLNYFRALISISLVIMILFSGIQIMNVSAVDDNITLRCAVKPLVTTNPLNADQDDWRILNLIYEGATKSNPETGERLPYIAVGSANQSENTFYISWADCVVGNFGYCPKDSWEDPAKPEMVIFYDFEDVYWHDGTQMNARDIMFTFQATADEKYPELGHPLADLGGKLASNYSDDSWLFIKKIWESEDGSRAALKFTLQMPYFSVFDYYFSAPILPYHIWGNTAGNQMRNNTMLWYDHGYSKSDEYSWKAYFAVKYANSWPIGSGPFRWEGSSFGSINLVPWEKHFYRPGFKYYSNQNKIMEQPQIDTLLLKFYDSDEQAIMDLEYNRIDYIAWDLSQASLSDYINNPNIRLTSLKATSMVYMGYNMKRKSFGYAYTIVDQSAVELDYGKPLRRALAHCIDSSSIKLLSNMYATDTDQLSVFSDWSNSSAPLSAFDPPEAISILRKANYVLSDPEEPPGEENWWYNPDGTVIGSSLDGKVQVLVIESEYDPVRFSIGTMLVSQMRYIGINAELVSLGPEGLEFRVNQRNYDIYLGDEDMSGIYGNGLENYAFSRFHSYNANLESNYYGYKNTSLDEKIFSAMDATDLQTRKALASDIMAALAYDLPQNVIYSRYHTEIYRIDNFYGLLDDGSGSMLNPSSIAGARMQEVNALKAKFIGLPITITSNLTVTFKVRVVDQHGNPMTDTYIRLETDGGSLLNDTGITNQYGTFTTNFTAPYVPLSEAYNNWEPVTIKIISATLNDYRDAPEMNTLVAVFPDYLRQLYIRATVTQDVFSDIDSSGNSGFTFLDIQTLDGNNVPVGGVDITIESFGGDLILSETELITDRDGQATIKVTASDIDISVVCMIQINGSKARFINTSQELNINIIPNIPEPEQAEEFIFSQIAVPLVISFTLLSVMGTVIYIRRRRKL